MNAGDELKLSTIGYKLDEPGFVYVLGYMDFVTIDTGVSIERKYYVPGQDFVDPNLVNLNAGPRKIKFLLEAYRENGSTSSYAFGGPFNLGFTWSGVPDFLFRGNMEVLVPDGTSVQAALFCQRLDQACASAQAFNASGLANFHPMKMIWPRYDVNEF
ncbi:MAG: hypothetical protein IPK97_14545 [Ahniella sp.]|nr:hypothetical protein [Ahniella sp.]